MGHAVAQEIGLPDLGPTLRGQSATIFAGEHKAEGADVATERGTGSDLVQRAGRDQVAQRGGSAAAARSGRRIDDDEGGTNANGLLSAPESDGTGPVDPAIDYVRPDLG
jgi:hypothetical protein